MYLLYLIQRHICASMRGALVLLGLAVEIGISLALLDCREQTVLGASEVEVRDEGRQHDDVEAEGGPRIEARVDVELTLELIKHILY